MDAIGLLRSSMFQKNKEITVGTHNQSTREKWLKKTISKIPTGSHILDAGAGELQYKRFCKNLKYTSQDFAQYEGDGDGHGLQMGKWDNSKLDIVSDITNIPVKNTSFDAIMCIEVLEHIPYPELAIKEFSRIIKKNGKLIITAPFCSMTHFSPYFFATGLSKYWYMEILSKYGFVIDQIKYNGNYFEYYAQETRRLYYMSETYAKTEIYKNKKDVKLVTDMLKLMERLSKSQKGSEEMLCFGLHILATKS